MSLSFGNQKPIISYQQLHRAALSTMHLLNIHNKLSKKFFFASSP